MKITLVGFKGNSVNIFPQLAREFSKKISGLELEQRFAPFPEDIPIVSLESAETSDFVIVFALLEEDDEIKLVKQKLIDVELKTQTRILKFVETDSFSGMGEDELEDEKEKTVQTIVSSAISILFNEADFEPQEE